MLPVQVASRYLVATPLGYRTIHVCVHHLLPPKLIKTATAHKSGRDSEDDDN